MKAFTSHIIAELENAQFIKNKYPFVTAKKYDLKISSRVRQLTQVLWVTDNISVKEKKLKNNNIHFININLFILAFWLL